MNAKWEDTPYSVICVVVALCKDYGRRKKILSRSDISVELRNRYVELNSAIEEELGKLEPLIAKNMVDDVGRGRGYNYSPSAPYIAKNTYYKRRHSFILGVAENLRLV